MRTVTFSVRGVPKPKGSLQPFLMKRRDGSVVARARHDNAGTSGWQSLVRGQAQTLYEPPFGGPVGVSILFRLPRPKSLPRRVVHCVKKPDVDKLARLVLDGLAGVLFARDQAVVELHARKVYATGNCTGCDCPLASCEQYRRDGHVACCPECKHLAPGAEITVREAAAPDPRPLALFNESEAE